MQPCRLVIGSCMHSSTSAEAAAKRVLPLTSKSILQTLALPAGESLISIFARRIHEEDAEGTPNGCLVVTTRGLYECRARQGAKETFLELLQAGKPAEDFGATLKLDVFDLYRRAANKYLHEGHIDLALQYHELAQTPPAAIVATCCAQVLTSLFYSSLSSSSLSSSSLYFIFSNQ